MRARWRWLVPEWCQSWRSYRHNTRYCALLTRPYPYYPYYPFPSLFVSTPLSAAGQMVAARAVTVTAQAFYANENTVLVATHGSIRHILRVTADFCDVRKDWRFYLDFGDRVNFWTELMTLARDGGCFVKVYDYYLAGRVNDVLRAMDTNNKHCCRS